MIILSTLMAFYGQEETISGEVNNNQHHCQIVLLGTGGSRASGGLYALSLLDLYRKNTNRTRLIYRDPSRGIITPAALADLTGDGVQDIVLATMNSNIMAFDGVTYRCLWNQSMPGMESLTAVALGLWDGDDVPDVIIKYNKGDQVRLSSCQAGKMTRDSRSP